MTETTPGAAAPVGPPTSLVSYTHWMYALHAASALMGVFTGAAIITQFVFGIPSIVAVVMNYVKRSEARGTWLESHFSWQLRTFWFALLAFLVIGIFSAPLVLLLGLGLVTWILGAFVVGIWIVYRVARGWLRLKDGRAVYAQEFIMVIAADKVVLIHYTLTNDAGEVLDSSSGGEPLAYLHGQGNIISGLEKALDGRQAGDKLSVRIEPADGYGVRDDSLVQQVPRRQFGGTNVQPGMQFHAQSSHGHARVVTVTHLQGDMVTVDGNHPLAGEVLNFDVEVTDIRDASAEELEHGHVHGPGGHHHHG